VFETGEEDANTEGAALVGRNARKGQLRMALSKDKDGNNFNDPNTARYLIQVVHGSLVMQSM
jgi:hypothetical protein